MYLCNQTNVETSIKFLGNDSIMTLRCILHVLGEDKVPTAPIAVAIRVKSGIFGRQLNSDSDLVSFIFQTLEKEIN